MPQVVGIKFENNPKIYHFETRGLDLHLGDKCVVETAMGLEIGTVAKGAFFAPPDNFKPVIRKAQKIDLDQAEANREKRKGGLPESPGPCRSISNPYEASASSLYFRPG